VIVAHIAGIPVEETVIQLAPVGAVVVPAIAVAGRTALNSLRRRLRHQLRRGVR
jgi:hypothetical protein